MLAGSQHPLSTNIREAKDTKAFIGIPEYHTAQPICEHLWLGSADKKFVTMLA